MSYKKVLEACALCGGFWFSLADEVVIYLPPDDGCVIVVIAGSFAESMLQHRDEQSGDILSTQHSLFLLSALNLHSS